MSPQTNMKIFSPISLIVLIISLPRFKAYQETFCLIDLCGLGQQARETCPELSGDIITDEFICSSAKEEKTKPCMFECSRTERSYNETMFVLRNDDRSYYCNSFMTSPEASNPINTIGFELSYLNCNLFINFSKLKLSSEKDSPQALPEFKRRAQESCIIRLNLYSVYLT